MARHQADREDLMQEATALVRRAEWLVPLQADPVVAGFKRSGGWSVYFGSEPVYQFDAQGRLRRAFADGDLWRTQGTTLARLHRERTDHNSGLRRYDLLPSELAEFLEAARHRLESFLAALDCSAARLVRQVPEAADLLEEITAALRSALSGGIVLAPPIPGKR